MNNKERMLAVINGQTVDQIPYVPRLDLWYRANARAGTLPSKYKSASLIDIVDDLDLGYHAVVPNFRDLRAPTDDADRPLGIYNLWTMPYRTVLENVQRSVWTQGDRTYVEYKTPVGTINAVVLYDENMRKAGITITHIEEYVFKNVRDYQALGYIFENMRAEPNYEGYRKFSEHVSDRGLAVAFVSLAGSPMHLIQRELMPMELFFYEMHDHSDELLRLEEAIGLYWNRVLKVVSNCPAEVVFVGANYDASVTYPPFFEQHIQPWLKKYAQDLHAKGKYLLTHTDGENSGLLKRYLDSEIDIADSVCPVPMTKLNIKQVRYIFEERITILGGIPSVALLKLSMSDEKFEQFLDEFFEMIGQGDHLILGISDTTPPAAEFGRLLTIKERIDNFSRK